MFVRRVKALRRHFVLAGESESSRRGEALCQSLLSSSFGAGL